ncbi:MAG TPA: M35 family metallo-endopeptidase [Blastocatellia bacterium]|jgi:hypothetical protein
MSHRGHQLSAAFGQSAPAALACDSRRIPGLATITPFTTNRVYGTCAKTGVFGVTAPGSVISAAVARAIGMLDNTIGELVNARSGVCAGRPPAWPLLGDVTADWLKNRLGVCIDDIRVWTAGTFVNGAVAEVIRRLTRVRNLIASNGVTYVCSGPLCSPGDWAYVLIDPTCKATPASLIRLCHDFWVAGPGVSAGDHAEFQAQTIIHEASHLYHCTADARGTSIGVAECLAQFVAATNGSPIDPNFATRCAVTNRCGAAAAPSGTSGFGAAAPGRSLILKTAFRPQNAIRLKGRPAARR